MSEHEPIDGEDEAPLTPYTFAMWILRTAVIGGVFWAMLEWFA